MHNKHKDTNGSILVFAVTGSKTELHAHNKYNTNYDAVTPSYSYSS